MPPVVLSMTTTPARNGTLGPTLYSLRMQSLSRGDLGLPWLWIYASKECDVPREYWVPSHDYGPVTKIAAVIDSTIPDDAIVVTVDDDIIYERTWLEQLVAAAETFPACAVGFSGWHVQPFQGRRARLPLGASRDDVRRARGLGGRRVPQGMVRPRYLAAAAGLPSRR